MLTLKNGVNGWKQMKKYIKNGYKQITTHFYKKPGARTL